MTSLKGTQLNHEMGCARANNAKQEISLSFGCLFASFLTLFSRTHTSPLRFISGLFFRLPEKEKRLLAAAVPNLPTYAHTDRHER
jgi:hypothetical protein